MSERKLRVALTTLGIVIGVATILTLLSLSAGIQQGILSSLERLGPNSIVISSRGIQLSQVDVSKVMEVSEINVVIPLVTERVNIIRSGQNVGINLIGTNNLETLLGEVKLIDGSIYPSSTTPLAIVGYNIAFPPEQGGNQVLFVGQPLILTQQFGQQRRQITVQIVGILDKYGSSAFISPDDSVFIPLDASLKILNRHSYNLLLARTADSSSVDSAAEKLSTIYGTNAQILTIQQFTETVSQITQQLSIFLGSIAAISLIVAGLGIMNIMLVSVFERTKVIGIMKAIGFKSRHVLAIFLSEAIIMGIIGSLVGILLGIGASELLPNLLAGSFGGGSFGMRNPSRTPSFSPLAFGNPSSLSFKPLVTFDALLLGLSLAIIVSLLAGLYPAWRASKMEPVKALRYE